MCRCPAVGLQRWRMRKRNQMSSVREKYFLLVVSWWPACHCCSSSTSRHISTDRRRRRRGLLGSVASGDASMIYRPPVAAVALAAEVAAESSARNWFSDIAHIYCFAEEPARPHARSWSSVHARRLHLEIDRPLLARALSARLATTRRRSGPSRLSSSPGWPLGHQLTS